MTYSSPQRDPAPTRVRPKFGPIFILIALTLSACGEGSSDSAPGAQPNEGDSAGLEPRVQLDLTAPARISLDVMTVSEQIVTVADESEQLTVVSNISVDVSLEQIGDEFTLNAISELQSLTPAELALSALPLYRISDTLNSRGERFRFPQRRDIYDVLSLDAFSLPALNLSVPSTPVGSGASWTDRNSLPLLNATTITTVEAISSDTISINKEINVGTDEQQRYTVSGSMEAVYLLPSLLIKSANIDLSIRIEDELYVNGVLQPVVDTRIYSQTIREASK